MQWGRQIGWLRFAPWGRQHVNEQPLGREKESYLSAVPCRAERGQLWLTLFQSSGTWRKRISAFTSKVPWLPQNNSKSSWCRSHWLKGGFTQKGKRAMSHPEQNRLGRCGWSWECDTAPSSLRLLPRAECGITPALQPSKGCSAPPGRCSPQSTFPYA